MTDVRTAKVCTANRMTQPPKAMEQGHNMITLQPRSSAEQPTGTELQFKVIRARLLTFSENVLLHCIIFDTR